MVERQLLPLSEALHQQGAKRCGEFGLPLTPGLIRTLALSRFASHIASVDPDWVRQTLPSFDKPIDVEAIRLTITKALAATSDIPSVKRFLRQARNCAQFHLLHRHIAGVAAYAEVVESAAALADMFIDAALDWCHRTLTATRGFGEPVSEAGVPMRLTVFALGKLGARELNLSSDVDLVLAYPESGATSEGKTCQQFFVRLAQMLVDLLDPVTADGFVYRTDLRLRPWGESGPLVMHFDAMEAYFETQGRDWERYAFIKARACAGDRVAGDQMLSRLVPFVYRRYLDFGAVQALREMKARIQAEQHGPNNIKLGPGGIREVEFGVQVMQLVWGGRQHACRQPALLNALPELAKLGHVDPAAVDGLRRAYVFLRDLEHSLQAIADQQTQTIPDDPGEQALVASMMGFGDVPSLMVVLDQHRSRVLTFFQGVIAPSGTASVAVPWDAVDISVAAFALGEPDLATHELTALKSARDRSSVGHEGRERLDALLPALLEDLRGRADAGSLLVRLVPILRSVLRRSAYLALLYENPSARRMLVDLVGRSRWVGERLCAHPMHMDALLDDRDIDELPGTATLRSAISERLGLVSSADAERRLDILREFREQYGFRIALAELRERLPLMRISDYYTFLAEALLQEALEMAWQDCDGPTDRPFIIIGYGKLGGLELGPDSDLDLVFLHDFEPDQAAMLQRLARRLLHILTANTYLGALYPIDTRLRPSGNAGTMVTSLAGFVTYQENRAWTWEHQALVRTRSVAGDPGLRARFEAIRLDLLRQARDQDTLKKEVVAMRARMQNHQQVEADLKRSAGGIVDIEFMVQYLVLAHAHEHPQLAEFPDNVRILEVAAACGVLPQTTASALTAAYLALRAEEHRRALDLPDGDRAARLLRDHEEVVRGTWNSLFA